MGTARLSARRQGTATTSSRADDLAGTSPGAALTTLFERFGPAVVLIDEWVAYARQLRDGTSDNGGGDRLAGGDFDTQFTFAQALTEAAAAVPNVVVLVSIPASDDGGGRPAGPHRAGEAQERRGPQGRRSGSPRRLTSPSRSCDGRLCSTRSPPEKAKVRDGVIRRVQRHVPRPAAASSRPAMAEGEYRRRMELCYPIHPELFDRLFDDWSALDKFQRTRGALRLMALAISELWKRDDRSLLIMPGNLPMDFGLLVSEMKKYLEDGWDPVIKSDVDGANSTAAAHRPQQSAIFGRLSAARRAARTVYMGSSPRPRRQAGEWTSSRWCWAARSPANRPSSSPTRSDASQARPPTSTWTAPSTGTR